MIHAWHHIRALLVEPTTWCGAVHIEGDAILVRRARSLAFLTYHAVDLIVRIEIVLVTPILVKRRVVTRRVRLSADRVASLGRARRKDKIVPPTKRRGDRGVDRIERHTYIPSHCQRRSCRRIRYILFAIKHLSISSRCTYSISCFVRFQGASQSVLTCQFG